MITKRIYKLRTGRFRQGHVVRKGYYLFGIIPLYIADLEVR